MEYQKHVLRGLSWIGGFRFLTRLLVFGKTAVLARVLLPAQFGVFGIAGLVLEFLEILTETGVNVFLIQEKDQIDEYIDTSWVVSIIRGILISLLILFATPFVVNFFHSPASKDTLFLISLVPFIRGFINPSVVKFRKELAFNKEFWYRSAIFIIETIFTIVLAIFTHSAVSLVWGLIGGAFLEAVSSYFIVKPIPTFKFNLDLSKEIVSRGKWVTGAGFFNYLFGNVDDILVGRILGVSSLGLYQVAYRISTYPVTEVASVFGNVTFPVYAKISNDIKKLKEAFFKMSLWVALLVIPFGLLIFFFAKEIVVFILGPKWIEAVDVLKVLSIFGIIKAVTDPAYSLFLAVKKQKYLTISTLAGIIGLAIVIFPLVSKYGIVGAGISAIVGTAVTVPFIIFFIIKILK